MTSAVSDAGRNRACPRTLAPREVLDMHADLQRFLSGRDPVRRGMLTDYARRDYDANPDWAPSHLHPARTLSDLSPWLDSLGGDLFGAATYQVTAEMVDLAVALQETTPDADDLRDDDLPAPWGFMWLDKPIDRPSVEDDGRPPLLMHALSWARVPKLDVDVRTVGEAALGTWAVPAVRIREWGYCDDPDVMPRPLHLMGQTTVPMSDRRSLHVTTPLPELWTVHMLWILMGMEISQSVPVPAPRGQRRRVEGHLRHSDVRVITLRRPKHGDPESGGGRRRIDWSCTWLVRGHWRAAPHGGTFSDGRDRTWIKPYLKGPDGLPLRAADVLWKLAR